MSKLRAKLVRLAYQKPEIRPILWPLIKAATSPLSTIPQQTANYLYNRTGNEWAYRREGSAYESSFQFYVLGDAGLSPKIELTLSHPNRDFDRLEITAMAYHRRSKVLLYQDTLNLTPDLFASNSAVKKLVEDIFRGFEPYKTASLMQTPA